MDAAVSGCHGSRSIVTEWPCGFSYGLIFWCHNLSIGGFDELYYNKMALDNVLYSKHVCCKTLGVV